VISTAGSYRTETRWSHGRGRPSHSSWRSSVSPSRRGNEQGNREWANLATSRSVAHDGPAPIAKATELIITAHGRRSTGHRVRWSNSSAGSRKDRPEITVWHDGGSRAWSSGQHSTATDAIATQNLSGPWLCPSNRVHASEAALTRVLARIQLVMVLESAEVPQCRDPEPRSPPRP